MYKTMVVAVDDSETSTMALYEAVNLCNVLKSKLWIIHVVNTSLPFTDMGYINLDVETYQSGIKKQGRSLLSKMETIAHSVGIKVETKLIEDEDDRRISELITESSSKLNAELLVLGSHGRRGMHRLLMGSVAEEVVRSVSIPILLVRAQVEETLSDMVKMKSHTQEKTKKK